MTIAAVGQICSTSSMADNLSQCVELIRKAAAGGAKVLFLPEASDYLASFPAEALSLARSEAESPFVTGLQSAAREHGVAINVGIHVPVLVPADAHSGVPSSSDTNNNTTTTISEPEPESTKKLLNRTIYITESGIIDPLGTYDKIHLFDFGSLRESAHTQAGKRLTPPFATPVGSVGSQICFDLRFPESALALANWKSYSASRSSGDDDSSANDESIILAAGAAGPEAEAGAGPAQILTYPSAFTVATGLAHWEVLLRARAVEAQCFVVAAAQVGTHHVGDGEGRGRRISYGHSMAVDPWGRVLCHLPGIGADGEEEGGSRGALGLFEVDLSEWEAVRTRMPLVRRPDICPGM